MSDRHHPPPTPRAVLHTLQDQLAILLGCGPGERTQLVAGMLKRNATESASYWLQLVVSIGIATLGLVLGSTAAVIGAMLVAPLMGPIIGLAMGLATGSPFLVLRTAVRVVLSVAIVVAGAALITVLLPFHQLNAEIDARTTPTVIDLLIAAFCALAGVYAALRPGSDTTTTAAGTSISISLVPPLCAAGYGVGTATWTVAGGAALLFLTNLVAIVFVGTASFVGAGFNRVNVGTIELDELVQAGDAPITRSVARRLAALFGSRGGPWLRFLMPLVLLAIVYVPLRRALNEVAWEVRVRAATQQAISGLKQPIVQSRVRVERHQVDVAIVLLGNNEDAHAARAQLERDIAPAAGVAPRLEVLAIPDAAAFAGLESTLRTRAIPAAPAVSPAASLSLSRARVRAALDKYWPHSAGGPILTADLSVSGSPILVTLVHLGPALAGSTAEVLQRSVSAEIGEPVRITTSALPAAPLARTDNDFAFIAELSAALHAARGLEGISVCAIRPPERPVAYRGPERAFDRAVLALLGDRPGAVLRTGPAWKISFVEGPCEPAVPDAGASDGMAVDSAADGAAD